MSGCHPTDLYDESMVSQPIGSCNCTCHKTGNKFLLLTNPPQPCCLCDEDLPVSPMVEQMQKLEIRIRETIDAMVELSMRMNKMESQQREFEKQRVTPFEERLSELEQWTRKEEDRVHERLKELEERINGLEAFEEDGDYAINDLRDRVKDLEESYRKKPHKCGVDELEFKIMAHINDLYQRREKNDYKKPHKCPVCDAQGWLIDSYLSEAKKIDCHACEGKGVVWS